MADQRRPYFNALQRVITDDLNELGEYSQEQLALVLTDVFGFTDGVIEGLEVTRVDSDTISISAGKLYQTYIGVQATAFDDINIALPLAGTRDDLVVARVYENLEELESRVKRVAAGSTETESENLYTEAVQRIELDYLTDTAIVPAGWILLANVSCTTTDITVTDSRSFSSANDLADLFSDPETYIKNFGYITGLTTYKNGVSELTDINTINFIEGSGITISHVSPGAGALNLMISTGFDEGVTTVIGTSGTVVDCDTIQFAAGTGVTSINVTEPIARTAQVTINASGTGGGSGILGLTREEQLGSDGVLTGGKYRFTLTNITYTPGNDDLLVYVGGQLLKKSTDYDEVSGSIVDLYTEVESDNSVTFLYTGDSGVTVGVDVSGTAGAGATNAGTLSFLAGDGIDNITVEESPAGTSTITIDIDSTLVDGSNADALHTHSATADTIYKYEGTSIGSVSGSTVNLISDGTVGSGKLQILDIEFRSQTDIPSYMEFKFTDGTLLTRTHSNMQHIDVVNGFIKNSMFTLDNGATIYEKSVTSGTVEASQITDRFARLIFSGTWYRYGQDTFLFNTSDDYYTVMNAGELSYDHLIGPTGKGLSITNNSGANRNLDITIYYKIVSL